MFLILIYCIELFVVRLEIYRRSDMVVLVDPIDMPGMAGGSVLPWWVLTLGRKYKRIFLILMQSVFQSIWGSNQRIRFV